MRKIIHIDMDCFYAAIEIRDQPQLVNEPVAIGGPANQRGVIATANYVARTFGIHSAMPTVTALRRCKNLVILPANIAKYKAVAKQVQDIFREYTSLVEPLALDEAYLDVTDCKAHQGSATFIAEAIREKISNTLKLTASAGVAPNKFLAKIGSGWNKPNGLFVIRPHEVEGFIKTLPVKHLHGVGKVTAQKFARLGLTTCSDVQGLSLVELTHHFGKFGERLYEQCRGIDSREVNPKRIRKSLSVEKTFAHDFTDHAQLMDNLTALHTRLSQRMLDAATGLPIKNIFVKIKFHDFKTVSLERAGESPDIAEYKALIQEVYNRFQKPVRLLGIGVSFKAQKEIFADQVCLF